MGRHASKKEGEGEAIPVLEQPEPDAIASISRHLCSWVNYKDCYPFDTVISPKDMTIVKGLAKDKSAPVIIMGETGTGKEEIAKLIHRLRSESEGKIPFVAVNCATISKNLAESLLFGHRRGAFTGADAATHGYIHEAHKGILFLDEIQALPLFTQQKLLRVLNDGTYNRLGETHQLSSHFQLITASTKDIDAEVESGRFLVDLRSRMTGIDMNLLPLRDRKEDIPALTALHLSRKGVTIQNSLFRELTEHLATFYWQGNVRQLFKALDSWLLISSFDDAAELSLDSFVAFKGMTPPKSCSKREELAAGKNSLHRGFDFNKDIYTDIDLPQWIERFETIAIAEAVQRHKNIGFAATALRLSRSTFDAKRRKHEMTLNSRQESSPPQSNSCLSL